ncbi:hypothetical protein lerEdw1_015625, partial [Lerista edwardsae]
SANRTEVMVAEALNISRETYFAILMDRACNGPVLVGSPQGGVDIEEVAAKNPELIFKLEICFQTECLRSVLRTLSSQEEIDIFEGVQDAQALRLAENLGFRGTLQQQGLILFNISLVLRVFFNICPLIPEVRVQQGWFLLAVGFWNGEEAKKCFQAALRGNGPNIEFQAGLALSVFACWTHSWADDLNGEAKGLMEALLIQQTENNLEVIVYLASLLQRTDLQRASRLVEDVIQSSLNPEVLRNAARICRVQSCSRAISVLQQAMALEPSYHLLHHDLGIQYMKHMEGAHPEEKGKMVAAAIESFKQAMELYDCAHCVFLAADQIKKLYNLFLKIDATQVEVNPFGETPEGQVVCFDAKMNFDDNAEFRQKEIFAMDDKSENEPIENEAAQYDLKYIGLDGNIACFGQWLYTQPYRPPASELALQFEHLHFTFFFSKYKHLTLLITVNGAGLAMATCDIISLNGGKPANFLDLGGGVKEAQVYQAFKLLTADPKVKSVNFA